MLHEHGGISSFSFCSEPRPAAQATCSRMHTTSVSRSTRGSLEAKNIGTNEPKKLPPRGSWTLKLQHPFWSNEPLGMILHDSSTDGVFASQIQSKEEFRPKPEERMRRSPRATWEGHGPLCKGIGLTRPTRWVFDTQGPRTLGGSDLRRRFLDHFRFLIRSLYRAREQLT